MLKHLRLIGLGALVLGVAFAGNVRGPLEARQGAQGAAPADPFDSLHFRSIGPATMSGRISDLAVYEKNPAIFYVGTAHGGVWKTTSNGAMYEAQFQDQGLMSVGDVTVSQINPDLVWMGTGESNNRQSTSWGNGVYKSTDGGKTWKSMGLATSYHINRIVIHPTDNNVVFVAATGSLFGPGGDRGVYKTTDAGATWKLVLKGDADTGANDLVMAETDPNIMFATMYQRRRTQCCMNGGGPGSGVFKSTDGGETWTRLEGGLPTVDMGRIAVDVYRRSANIVYALVEAEGPARGGGAGRGGAPAAAAGAAGGRGAAAPAGPNPTGLYRSDDGGGTWRQVNTVNPRPMYFSQVRIDPNNPETVYMGGVGLHMTIDGGRSFATDAAQAIHDDIHAIWINPDNPNHLLIGGDGGVAVTYDQSKTWTQHNNLPLALYYHVSVDMATPYNVCGGLQDNYNWCGPSATRFTRGILNSDFYQVQGGDGFVVLVDPINPNIVYSESQNGNISRKNAETGESRGIRPTFTNTDPPPSEGAPQFRFNWDTPLVFSPHENGAILAAANKVFRSSDRGDSWSVISQDLTTNADRSEIAVMGKRGNEIRIAANDGITSWPTIVSLAESPKTAGVYYTGTDDGVVSVSRDAGKTWTNVTKNIPGLPTGAWISEVVPSRFDAGTVYVTADAHRLNDYKTHTWVSNDFGATFRSLNANLTDEVVKTLTEDTKNADVLYIGTETGLFLTLDRGKSWKRLKANLPTVRVDEITIHPRDNAMIVATHGRALWILDHLEPIQEYAAAQATTTSDATLFSIGPALQWRSKDHQNDEFWGHGFFAGENPPTDAVIQFHLKKPVGALSLKITDTVGKDIRTLQIPTSRNQAGIQTVCWDMRVDPAPAIQAGPAAQQGGGGRQGGGQGGGRQGAPGGGRGSAVPGVPSPMPPSGSDPQNPCGGGGGGFGGFGGGGGNQGPLVLPGNYNVALMVDGKAAGTKSMRVVLDPANQLSDVQRKRYYDIVMDLHGLQTRGVNAANAVMPMHEQMTDIAGKIGGMADVPEAVKTQFASVQKEWDTVREKFGVPPAAPAGGGRGGRGGRGGGAPANPADVVGKAGAVKGQIMTFYDMPSTSLMNQYNDVRLALPRAITELNAFLAKATSLSQALAKHNLTLTVPPPVR